MSNELDKGDDNYVLLSLHAQCTLGFVKDMVTGKCYLKEYDDYCQLYESEGSGLRAICVSDFEDNKSLSCDFEDHSQHIGNPKQWEGVNRGEDELSYLDRYDEGEFPKATAIGNDMKKDLIIMIRHDLGEDQVSIYETEEITLTPEQLDDLVKGKKRSYNTYDEKHNRKFVNKMSWHSWIKATQWNVNCMKTAYIRDKASSGTGWRKSEDRVNIIEYTEFEEPTDVVVIVHHEGMTWPNKPSAIVGPSLDDDKRQTFSDVQRKKYVDAAAYRCHADESMWSELTITKEHVPESRKFRLPEGRRKLIIELFCGVTILTTMATAFGWATSQPTDVNIDKIEIPFPCGSRNSTYFNMELYAHIKELQAQTSAYAFPAVIEEEEVRSEPPWKRSWTAKRRT
eukprot:14905477-Heterocapsa_arctica.AAC.1